MEWNAEWIKAQQDLSAASRNYQWWQSLSPDRRRGLGQMEYRAKRKQAYLALKAADKHCRMLFLAKRQAGGKLSLPMRAETLTGARVKEEV